MTAIFDGRQDAGKEERALAGARDEGLSKLKGKTRGVKTEFSARDAMESRYLAPQALLGMTGFGFELEAARCADCKGTEGKASPLKGVSYRARRWSRRF